MGELDLAIVGVGCTKFGENMDDGYDDLVVDAAQEAFEDAGVGPDVLGGAWLGTCLPDVGNFEGNAGSSLSQPLHLYPLPVTRVANYCATGSDAFRNACLGVLSGEMDFALALGAEKMRDVGTRETAQRQTAYMGHPVLGKGLSSAGFFAFFARRHADVFGLTRKHLAKIAVKNHGNGVRNPKAHFRFAVTEEQVLAAPMLAEPIGLFDACPTTDGAAAAVVTRRSTAERLGLEHVAVTGLSLAVSGGFNVMFERGHDYLSLPAVVDAVSKAYCQAGITDPRHEIDVAEVHDCFTIAEAVVCEDVGFSAKGKVKDDIDDGVFLLEGELPVNPSGGLKASGHPIGATGLRMIYEVTNQLRGRAGAHQVSGARRGLVENFGGPGTVSVAIVLEATE